MRVRSMKFLPPRRRNPFDNVFLGLLLHGTAISGMFLALYFALANGTLVPLYIGFAVLTLLEAMWLYFRLRR